MAEFIERETLISALESEFEDNENCRLFVSKIPTADVVEVVRCSECKHYHDPMRCALWYGTLGDNEYFLEHGKDFYCAFGERRLENENT